MPFCDKFEGAKDGVSDSSVAKDCVTDIGIVPMNTTRIPRLNTFQLTFPAIEIHLYISKTSVDDQKEAKAFIADLMGGDEVGEDGGNPTTEDLRILAKKVLDLSDAALGIVASITGAPSVESFREGFTMLVPEDLKSMRQLFRRMGLNE